jgi:hypothetical protein
VELQRRLDAGDTTPMVPAPEVKRRTIAEEAETHLTAKTSRPARQAVDRSFGKRKPPGNGAVSSRRNLGRFVLPIAASQALE